jgi:hypothetical protein
MHRHRHHVGIEVGDDPDLGALTTTLVNETGFLYEGAAPTQLVEAGLMVFRPSSAASFGLR